LVLAYDQADVSHPSDASALMRPQSKSKNGAEGPRLDDTPRPKHIETGPKGRRFLSRQLVPEGILSRDSWYSLVVEPLYFRENQLGFVLFKVGPREGIVYETLHGQISSALKGALLVQQVSSRALQLQTAAEVSRAASSILDPEMLIQQVVNLALERFDLYYAGLFLVYENREWAVLRAGTGESGRKMLEQGHKLRVGGDSMVGQCVAKRQACIALDVGAEPVRFANPLLPETRSEMALPLVSRGETIGALTIQSAQEAAFSAEDIAVLQTMADQLANAIANARLYEQARREIAERKAAEEALRVSEERFALAVQGSNDGIYDWDIVNNTLYWSPRLKEMLGYADDELDIDFDTFDSLLHPDDREHIAAAIEAHLRDRIPYDVEHRMHTKSGEYRWFRARGQALWDEAGNPVRMVGSTTDITERKAAEEALKEYSERLEEMVEERTQELRDAQEQLIRQEKLAVLGQLAGGVGHELRNPLGAISNAVYFLNMVLEEPDPEVKETLEILQKEVRTSEMIISSLLDFARTKAPTRRKVDINDVVQEALSRTTVQANVEVVSQLYETLPIILADPDQLGQVFGNIILNAVQAMPEGGQLLVKTEAPSPEWMAISFTDTGVGIPEENLDKLFEPLFTTKAKGIGLGLAVTKTLVEGHGGTIEVESERGVGTTLTVRLPISVS